MRSKRLFRTGLVTLCIVILVGSAFWYFRGDLFETGEDAGQERSPTPVTVVTAETGTILSAVEAVGTTQAREQVLLTANVTDKVAAIDFEEGSFVEEGQLLVQLHASEARAVVAGAIAVRDEARQALRRAQELDTGRFIAEADVDERQRRFETAEAELEQARAWLADYAIKAPFSGRIGIRQVSPGSLVTPDAVIATLTTVDPIELHFQLPASLLPQLHPGMRIYAQRSGDAGLFEGVVTTIDATVDPGTRTVALVAESPNGDGVLRPGMFMMVEVVLDVVSGAVLVPEEAILLRGAETFVFVAKDGVVERVTVETGARREGMVEIREGIGPGASVVVAGLQRISDGQRVEATPAATAQDGETDDGRDGGSDSDDAPAPGRQPNGQRSPQEFRDLVLRSVDGTQITLGDVARIELGAESYRGGVFVDQEPAIGLGIVRQSGTNTLAVANAVKARVEEIRDTLPADISVQVAYDVSQYIEGSIREVVKTLVIAAVLVILVIFVFLRSARSTLVPAVTVPVFLSATFIVLYALGLSVNTLTLLALILAVGLVVDDGIVVLENIFRRIEKGEPRLLGATRGADEIGFAVIATTLVLVAVFLPLNFLSGEVGRLFGQFGLALAAAVSFSSFVALTAGAMLASKVVSVEKLSLLGLLARMDKGFDAFNRGYRRGLERTVAVPSIVIVGFAVLSIGACFLYAALPQELAPVEDRGVIFIPVEAPEGATFAYTREKMEAIEEILDGYRGDDGPVERTISIIGLSQEEPAPTNEGLIIVRLDDWGERDIVQQDFADALMPQLLAVPGVQAFAVNPPSLGQGQFQTPVQFVVAGTRFENAQSWGRQILDAAEQMPELVNARINTEETKPELRISIDRRRAADLGLSVRDISETLQVMLSTQNVTEFPFQAQTYDVIPRAEPEDRTTPEDLEDIFVRAQPSGELIPLRSVIDVAERGVANELQRVNRLPAVTISASLAPGVALGDALDALEQTAREILPPQARLDYLGQSEEYQRTRAGTYIAFGLAFLVIFLVLAGQFESFIHPVIVLLPAPLAVSGGLLALLLTGQSFNIYSQISLILVIGLMAKNAILVVEFANQIRERTESVRDAVVEAASVRMRPILMTSVATALGALPLALATGPGAQSRYVIGVVVIGGIVVATLLTLFVVPIFYILLAR